MPFQKRPPRAELVAELKRNRCKVAPVARHFHVSRRAVYFWLDEYKIEWDCEIYDPGDPITVHAAPSGSGRRDE